MNGNFFVLKEKFYISKVKKMYQNYHEFISRLVYMNEQEPMGIVSTKKKISIHKTLHIYISVYMNRKSQNK